MTDLLTLAAQGDRDALAIVRDELLTETEYQQSGYRRDDLWAQAEIIARLAACHGNGKDAATLVGILLVRSTQCEEDGSPELAEHLRRQADDWTLATIEVWDAEVLAEIIELADGLANAGDPSATPYLELIFSRLTKDQAVEVKTVLDRAKAVA